MIFSPSEVLPIVESTGFRADMIEKVLQLINLLDKLNRHPQLKGKWVLKGGTALNLFVFDLPRLSVDIDLNYIGALDREAMLAERPRVEQAAQAVFSREGFITKRVPLEHAGGKWRLSYQSYTGQSGNLEVDLNFMFRQPSWVIQSAGSHMLGDFHAKNIPLMNLHELAAGKLAALLARAVRQEALDLQWEDIKFDYGELGLIHFHRTKNGRDRTMQLGANTRAALVAWRDHLEWMRHLKHINPVDTRFVFCRLDGTRIHRFDSAWRSACKRAGIENFHFYDLRHTYCSYIILNGGGIKAAKEMIGHFDISMTDRYAHLPVAFQEQIVQRLSSYYAGKGEEGDLQDSDEAFSDQKKRKR